MATAPGNFMHFVNKQTGQSYASPQEAYLASQGAGAAGSGAGGGGAGGGAAPLGPQQNAGQAWSQATGNPYFGSGSYKNSNAQPAANVQDWFDKYGGGGRQGDTIGGGAPQGPGGMNIGYSSALPENATQARERLLGNISATRNEFNSPEFQALMKNIFGTATGGPSDMMNLLSQTAAGARAGNIDANARAQQLQQRQIAQTGDRAGVNTGQAQIESRVGAGHKQMDDMRDLDMTEGASKLRLMGAAQDQFSTAVQNIAGHQLGVSQLEAPLMAQMFDVEDGGIEGWQGALSGGSILGGGSAAHGLFDIGTTGSGKFGMNPSKSQQSKDQAIREWEQAYKRWQETVQWMQQQGIEDGFPPPPPRP